MVMEALHGEPVQVRSLDLADDLARCAFGLGNEWVVWVEFGCLFFAHFLFFSIELLE